MTRRFGRDAFGVEAVFHTLMYEAQSLRRRYHNVTACIAPGVPGRIGADGYG